MVRRSRHAAKPGVRYYETEAEGDPRSGEQVRESSSVLQVDARSVAASRLQVSQLIEKQRAQTCTTEDGDASRPSERSIEDDAGYRTSAKASLE
jgi:hypothetical protein